jgi:tRNA 2-selenouridine synthase
VTPRERTASESLHALRENILDHGWIDVRSEKEFAEGHFPGFVNIPILNDDHRHQVGLCYKTRGQAAAVELGHELVDPLRPRLIAAWRDVASRSRTGTARVACWRGGMRSQIASDWMAEAGIPVERIVGGYKALRREVLGVLEKRPSVILLSGPTGSGKTVLLNRLKRPALDLEGLAVHRGSSFGRHAGRPQPAQATFENLVGLRMMASAHLPWVVEDESRLVGRLLIPRPLLEAMQAAPRVVLESPIEDRVRHVHAEYVNEPLDGGRDRAALLVDLSEALGRIRNRLGGLREQQLQAELRKAFEADDASLRNSVTHRTWIEPLLLEYYDPLYQYAASRRAGPVVFKGNEAECRAYLEGAS